MSIPNQIRLCYNYCLEYKVELIVLKQADLIAPNDYNIVMEIERYIKDPKKVALIFTDETKERQEITYLELMNNANKIGNIMLNAGLKKGDKVLIMMPRLIESYEVYLAALKTGIIIIPSSEMLTTADLQFRVTHGEVDGVISYYPFVDEYKDIEEYDQLIKFVIGESEEGWHFIDDLKQTASSELNYTHPSKDDIAFLPYTSGTTGSPKAVVHTHEWGYAHLRTVSKNWLDIKENDKVWATAAPGWQKWVWSPLLSTLGSGATGFVYNGRFKPRTYLNFLQKEQINVLCCTPTEYRMMARVNRLNEYDLSALRSAVSAGEPLNKEVIDIFKNNFDLLIRDGYGQTENTLLLGVMKDMQIRPGSMGKPTPGNEVDIIDEEGNPVEIGVVGDIAVKRNCPALFKAYYKDEARTQKTMRGDYYVTGDRASKDSDGYFWYQGRDDDIIISSGYTIGPFEVEEVLLKHPLVKDCAVVASPDPVRGQLVKAYVVLYEPVSEEEERALITTLQKFSKKETAPYKYPRKIEFIDELPKTISGKTRRVTLREREYQMN